MRLVPVSTLAARAVSSERAVTVAPLSISIRRCTPLIDRHDPEMAVRRHLHPQFPARDLLVVEAEAARQPRQLGLIGRLLKQDEDEEGEQAEREGEADEPADDRDPLKQHDDERRGDRVERKLLPLREDGGIMASMWRGADRGKAAKCAIPHDRAPKNDARAKL